MQIVSNCYGCDQDTRTAEECGVGISRSLVSLLGCIQKLPDELLLVRAAYHVVGYISVQCIYNMSYEKSYRE